MALITELQQRVNDNVAALESEIEEVLRELESFLNQNLPRIIREAQQGNRDPIEGLNALINAFRTGGVNSQLGNITEIFGNELRRIGEDFESLGIMSYEQFQTLIDLDTVESLIRLRINDIENKAVETLSRLRPVILENVILGTQIDELVLSQTASNVLLNFTRTELTTALISFNRMITLVQAEQAGLDLFLYIGPNDKITRPFCRRTLNKKNIPIFTKKEIEAMDNGQGLPVITYGGGYNCRHSWGALTLEKARELGYKG